MSVSTYVVQMGNGTHYAQGDATLCDEYLDPTLENTDFALDLDAWKRTSNREAVSCVVCQSEGERQIMESSRAFVARELGVDISEVF